MKTLASNGIRSIKSTGYSPKFAFESLKKMVGGRFEYLKANKSRNTNSYYIETGEDDYSKNIEIRVSDHTKMTEKHEVVLMNTKNDLQLDVISKEDFVLAKKLIEEFI